MESKRETSGLIPYKLIDEKIFVYLQKRPFDAKRLPGYFAFFGGGKEVGETPEQTLVREIKEELNFEPKGYQKLGDYDLESGLRHYYILEVNADFENQININLNETDFGRFFEINEALRELKISDDDKLVLRDLQKIILS